MVQKELEAQATQLIEHCQYGLEQVEAEKLLLVAGEFRIYLLPYFDKNIIRLFGKMALTGCDRCYCNISCERFCLLGGCQAVFLFAVFFMVVYDGGIEIEIG